MDEKAMALTQTVDVTKTEERQGDPKLLDAFEETQIARKDRTYGNLPAM